MDKDLARALVCCAALALVLGGVYLALGHEREEDAPEDAFAPLEDPPSVIAWRARRDQAASGSTLVAIPPASRPTPTPAPDPPAAGSTTGTGSEPRLDPVATPPPPAHRPATLEAARSLPLSERNLGRACLLVAALAGLDFDLEAADTRLGEIARAARDRAGPRPTARAALDALAHAIHVEAGIAYAHGKPDGIDARNAYLPLVMSGRAGMCVSLAALYLSVAERAGIPLAFVELPGHVFVRYVGPGGPINIETTSGGGAIDDADYRARHPFDDAARGYYLVDRPPQAVVAGLLMTVALVHWSNATLRDRALEEALRWDPEHLYAGYNLASAHLASARHAEAVPLYTRFTTLRPEESAGWIGLARAAIGVEDLALASSAIDRAAALAPDAGELCLARAELAIGEGHFGDVEAVLGRAPAAANGFEGRVLRALAQSRAGQPATALPHWQAALALEPASPVALRGLARDLEKLGRDRELAPVLEAVLLGAPDDVPALVSLGAVRYRARDADGAIRLFERAHALAPTSDVVANNLARAELLAGRPDRALDIGTQALRACPTSVPLLLLVGQLHLEHRRDPIAARRYLEKYRELGGTEETVLRWLDREPR